MDSGIPSRQIHLDFHTGPTIPEVGAAFDAAEFASTLAEAGVESVTLFAKCHHGHLYYETRHPARHPNLKRNLLEEQIEALRARGIRTPIYLSVQCDEFAANAHPEWLAVNPDGSRVGKQPLSANFFSWQILDLSSPYLDYLCAQTAEVIEKFRPVDGLFFDMCWDQPSVSCWALAGMEQAGLRPKEAADRARYARQVAHSFMERISSLVAGYQKEAAIWFNSRPMSGLREEARFLKHVEIEALPTGPWGYAYFPVNIRLVRPLGLPVVGMTGRFHKSWADFGGLRTAASLLHDCAQALAHGSGCSVGDQLHPSGRIDRGVYTVIGQVFDHAAQCEPWVRGSRPVKEIAVLCAKNLHTPGTAINPALEGVYRTLTPLGYQYAFLRPEDAWEEYPLVVVTETVHLDEAARIRLDSYLAGGGKILFEGSGEETSPYTTVYLRFEAGARGGLPESDHAFYERGKRLLPKPGDDVLAWIAEPYFERSWEQFCSHAQTPPKVETSPYAAGLVRGGEAHLALPVFRAAARHGNPACRQLLAAAIARLLPEPALRLKAPGYVEAVANDQPGRRVVHLLSFVPQKKTPDLEIIEEAMPARHVSVAVRVPRPACGATVQPGHHAVPFSQKGEYATVDLEWIKGHQIVVIDW